MAPCWRVSENIKADLRKENSSLKVRVVNSKDNRDIFGKENVSRVIVGGTIAQSGIDTIGIAHPGQVRQVLDVLLTRIPANRIALHFHDTRGTALANVLAALEYGIATFDSSAGGLGGCPYAPGAAGNLATEDLVYMLDGLGITSGVSREGVMRASLSIEELLGHPLPSRWLQAQRASR